MRTGASRAWKEAGKEPQLNLAFQQMLPDTGCGMKALTNQSSDNNNKTRLEVVTAAGEGWGPGCLSGELDGGWGERFVPGPQVTARETFSETRFMGIRSRRVSFLLTFSITSFDTQRFFVYLLFSFAVCAFGITAETHDQVRG